MKRPRTVHTLAAAAGLTFLAVPCRGAGVRPGRHARRPPGRPAPIDLDAIRTRCLAAVDRRFATLDELDAKVTRRRARVRRAGGRAARHRSPPPGPGSPRCATEIEGDTDAADLRTDCKRIVDDHRVYVLLAPQVRLTVGRGQSRSPRSAPSTRWSRSSRPPSTRRRAGGADVTEATGLLDAMKSATAEADSLWAAVLAAVSPLTPADYNDGSAVTGAARRTRRPRHGGAVTSRSARANAKAIADLCWPDRARACGAEANRTRRPWRPGGARARSMASAELLGGVAQVVERDDVGQREPHRRELAGRGTRCRPGCER